MKKVYYLVLATIFPFMAMAQYVPEEQTPLMVKKTATWCNPCGTWGWELFGEIWDERESESVILEMHNSSSSYLYAPAALDLYGFHESRSSTPVFYVNTINEVEYSSGGGIFTGGTKTNVIDAIDSTRAASPVANAGISYSVNNGTLNIDTKTRFFQSASGEYYLGVYLAENDVEEQQNGISGTATHKRIMRASAESSIEGVMLVDGTVSAGDEFTNTHQINLESGWNSDNLYVFTVIWKKENSKFNYVNASKQKWGVGVDEHTQNNVAMKIYPNAIRSGESFNIALNQSLEEGSKITIYDQIGKEIKSINVNSSGETIKVEDTSGMNKGLYFVQLTSENGQILKSMKLVVKG